MALHSVRATTPRKLSFNSTKVTSKSRRIAIETCGFDTRWMVAQAFAGSLTKAFYGPPMEHTAMAEATIPDLSSGSPGPQDDSGPAEPVRILVTRPAAGAVMVVLRLDAGAASLGVHPQGSDLRCPPDLSAVTSQADHSVGPINSK
jgi:hypothetical protein